MLQPLTSSHMTAKAALRELKDFLKFICPPETMPSPRQPAAFNLPERPYFSKDQKALRDKWLFYLTWEEKNPLQLTLSSEGDMKEYTTRMRSVYRKAVVKMRFYGEVWYVICRFQFED
jgi:cleavage stimulation factor subunit 3